MLQQSGYAGRSFAPPPLPSQHLDARPNFILVTSVEIVLRRGVLLPPAKPGVTSLPAEQVRRSQATEALTRRAEERVQAPQLALHHQKVVKVAVVVNTAKPAVKAAKAVSTTSTRAAVETRTAVDQRPSVIRRHRPALRARLVAVSLRPVVHTATKIAAPRTSYQVARFYGALTGSTAQTTDSPPRSVTLGSTLTRSRLVDFADSLRRTHAR